MDSASSSARRVASAGPGAHRPGTLPRGRRLADPRRGRRSLGAVIKAAYNPAASVPSKAEALLNQLAAHQATTAGAAHAAAAAPAAALPGAPPSPPAALLQQWQAALPPQPDWQQLQPHWGTQLAHQAADAAQQLLHLPPTSSSSGGSAADSAAESAAAALYDAIAGAVALPQVDLPQLPQLQAPQWPEVRAPQLPPPPALDAPELQAAAQQLLSQAAHLPQQLQAAAAAAAAAAASAAAGGGGGGGAPLPPHFGTQAASAWLAPLLQWLEGLLSAPLAAARDAAALPAAAGAAASEQLGAAAAAAAAHLGLPAAWTAALGGLASGGAGAEAAAAALGALPAALEQLQEHGMGGHSFATLCLVAAGAAAAIAASVPDDARAPPEDASAPRLTHEYDAEAVAAYFEARPLQVAARAAQLARQAAGFGALLLWDVGTGSLAANEAARARQLRVAIEALGPAYVKVAQALSTRVDLLSPQYFEQIQLLQDRVPPFPCEEAKQAMAAAFGRPVEEVLASLSERPVAAASLGQVYKGTLSAALGGGEVAIKVQRPDVLETVCLDLHLMRRVAAALQRVPGVTTDWAALIDAWAVRFLHEMDYEREARNAELFTAQMAQAGVAGVVTAPVLGDLSSDTVLVTQWVDGEKLSESDAADVRALCSTLLNAYLIQLLDTGFLHADPHPGNLVRTPDGNICVLDFGLMTEVTPEQRIALVEYIAHLVTQDWEGVARDLQTLGFIPPEAGDPVALGIVPPLGRILSQLSGGGGATKLNIDAVMSELEELGRTYPFRIPAFFALILRAFSVIEGIALRVDPDYSIVAECFPYIARRLLADPDPRARAALRDVLYGRGQRLDVARLMRLADAFAAFTTDGLEAPAAAAPAAVPAATPAAAAGGVGGGVGGSSLSPAVREALLLVFAPGGSYMQELLVDELVAAADALSREAASELLRRVLGSAPAAAALGGLAALGPLRPLVLPVPTPLELLSRLAPAVAVGPEDEEALGVVRGVFQLLQRAAPGAPRPLPPQQQQEDGPAGGVAATAEAVVGAARLASEVAPLLPELLPGLGATAEMFVRAFVRRAALRVAEASSASAEYEQAMAAVGFVAGAPGGRGGVGGAAAGDDGLARALPAAPSSSNQFGYYRGVAAAAAQAQAQQAGAAAGGQGAREGGAGAAQQRPAVRPTEGGAAAGGPGELLPSAGQLVTALVAAPLLLVFTPLALLEQQRRYEQQRRDSKWL